MRNLLLMLFMLTCCMTNAQDFPGGLDDDGRGNDEITFEVYVSDKDETTNVRNNPNGKIVAHLKNGDMISVDYSQNGWFHIAANEWYGADEHGTICDNAGDLWIHSSVVSVDWHSDGGVKFELRKAPGRHNPVKKRGLGLKYPIERILDYSDGWAKLKLKGGFTGWVEIELLCGNSLTTCI